VSVQEANHAVRNLRDEQEIGGVEQDRLQIIIRKRRRVERTHHFLGDCDVLSAKCANGGGHWTNAGVRRRADRREPSAGSPGWTSLIVRTAMHVLDAP